MLTAMRSRPIPSASVGDPALSLKNLALLEPKRLLAKVGDVELRSEDLHEVLQSEFQGQTSHAGLSAEDLGLKVGQVLDALVQDELLAQAARQDGLKTSQKACAGAKGSGKPILGSESVQSAHSR